jgi:hypothetical protein
MWLCDLLFGSRQNVAPMPLDRQNGSAPEILLRCRRRAKEWHSHLIWHILGARICYAHPASEQTKGSILALTLPFERECYSQMRLLYTFDVLGARTPSAFVGVRAAFCGAGQSGRKPTPKRQGSFPVPCRALSCGLGVILIGLFSAT